MKRDHGQFLMNLFVDGHWLIGSDPEANSGGVFSQKTGLSAPPETGWKYFDHEWIYDAKLSAKSKPVTSFSIFWHLYLQKLHSLLTLAKLKFPLMVRLARSSLL